MLPQITGGKEFDLQQEQYRFPYHHIPYFDENGTATRHRILSWGWEYLCYQHHIRERVRELCPATVLEVGCGDGYFIGHLGSDIPQRIGVDVSGDAIRFARAFHPEVTFIVGDASSIEDRFDVVVAIEVLEHVPDNRVGSFIRMLFERVRPGGTVVLSVPTVVVPLNRKHYRHYTWELLLSQLRAARVDFRVLTREYIFRLPRWLKLYLRLTNNRLWLLEPLPINSWIWRYIWQRLRVTSESNGRHLVVMLKRA